MPDIRRTQRRFTVVLVTMLAICAAAGGVLLSPVGRSSRARRQQLEQLRSELRVKAVEADSFRGIGAKVKTAKEQVAGFYQERLLSSYASISEKLGAVAEKSGVTLGTGHYHAASSGVPDLQRLEIEASITGDYTQAVKFINALEREKAFFLIDSITLSPQQSGIVQLQLRIEALLKEA
jgi:Tfp pilus assembly protein PilO